MKVLLRSVWIFEKCRRKEDCLFAENWMIVANCDFCESLACCAASATPTVISKLVYKFLGDAGHSQIPVWHGGNE